MRDTVKYHSHKFEAVSVKDDLRRALKDLNREFSADPDFNWVHAKLKCTEFRIDGENPHFNNQNHKEWEPTSRELLAKDYFNPRIQGLLKKLHQCINNIEFQQNEVDKSLSIQNTKSSNSLPH